MAREIAKTKDNCLFTEQDPKAGGCATELITRPSPRDASTSKNGLVLGDFGQTVKLTITVLVHPLPIMVDAHVVSELVRHDQSTATQASRLGYCAGCLSF